MYIKVIQGDTNPIKVAYRFRTKGLQWIWIQTRYQINNDDQSLNPKYLSIRGYNEVIGINEISSIAEIMESQGSKKSHSISLSTNDLNEGDFLPRNSVLININKEPTNESKISFQNGMSFKDNSANNNNKLDKSLDSIKDNRQIKLMDSSSNSSSSLLNMAPIVKSENKIDQNMEVYFK